MSTESKPIKDAADLLSRFPVSGRHYRYKTPLYDRAHVMQFMEECARVATERVKESIGDMVINSMENGITIEDMAKKIAGININDLIK